MSLKTLPKVTDENGREFKVGQTVFAFRFHRDKNSRRMEFAEIIEREVCAIYPEYCKSGLRIAAKKAEQPSGQGYGLAYPPRCLFLTRDEAHTEAVKAVKAERDQLNSILKLLEESK